LNQGRIQAWVDWASLIDQKGAVYLGHGGKLSLRYLTFGPSYV